MEQHELGERVKGFAAGTVSGLTKLAVGHPFDTVKVRLQCSPPGTYKGMLDCIRSILHKEGVLGVYKGCVPPAIGWMFTDSIMLGSMHTYCRIIGQHFLHLDMDKNPALPARYQNIAGIGAGWTTAALTTPIELLKTKLQMQRQRVQLSGTSAQARPEFQGTWDCIRQVYRTTGVRGFWQPFPAVLWFRTSFGPLFVSYEYFQVHLGALAASTQPYIPEFAAWCCSPASVTFLSGGLAAEVYWVTAYPADVVKNRMMADALANPRYGSGFRGTFRAAKELWAPADQNPKEKGVLGLALRTRRIYTGFLTCALRAFPTNASALLAFETVMYLMHGSHL
ncbi:hypothetical protein MVES1_001093 [Malassezia vespertilionis]|uniref:Uncharacterized protein n=1 Tax=Malassezia vespertilionis TaxID=2020962 RepID=A0A2N1JF66_9BASI|nr:uncharacterized protein MVES1_001093 [Malassezia vespertilionis]PKI85201.1 hypothetical protein MVES_001028 [Malassezia vespertilionis]WFD05760.1 hypothetical protein MVES1_001093 [Malassezia vespertilionis]